MKYLTIWTFRPEHRDAVVQRFGETGGQPPDGVTMLARLHDVSGGRGFAVSESDDPVVVSASVPLLRIAAVFQISDGLQAVAAGALRGAGDTRSTVIANVIGHYGVGLPVALILGFSMDMGASGLWWGLSVGLTVTAAALVTHFLRLSARPIARR